MCRYIRAVGGSEIPGMPVVIKGQLISKTNCQAEDSSKERTNEFVLTSMWRVFVCFLEESSARKKNVSRLSDL